MRNPAFRILFVIILATPSFPGSIACAQTQANYYSKVRLVGTIMAGAFSGAVVIESDGRQMFYRLHESFSDGSQLVQVRDDSIFIKRGDGQREEVFIMHGSGSSGQASGSQPPVASAPVAASPPAAPAAAPVVSGNEPARPAASPGKRRRSEDVAEP